jgi:phosphoenolpyruvate carboxylase
MYRQWPFFRTLLSNMDMVLAKSDLALASRYAELVTDARCARRCLPPSRPSGTARPRRWRDHRRQAAPGAQRRAGTVHPHRFPYIDPLHHLQVELVRRYRAGQGDERVQTRYPHLDQRDCGGVAQYG